jgi:hypothetical protein
MVDVVRLKLYPVEEIHWKQIRRGFVMCLIRWNTSDYPVALCLNNVFNQGNCYFIHSQSLVSVLA